MLPCLTRLSLPVLGLLATTLLAVPAHAGVPGPLPADKKAIFEQSPEDPPAQKLLGISEEFVGRHYVTGDEFHPDVWYPHIRDLGGGYVGVGADQAYLHVGWQRPELAWLIDYDPLVVDLHAIYRIFFAEAQTIDAFLKLWTPGGATQALDRIDHHYASHPKHKLYRQLYKQQRGNIAYRLQLVRKAMQKAKVPCYLTDGETYAFVRDLYAAGRIRPLSANLLEKKGLKGVGEAARQLGVPIRVLYLSNAEEYWPYSATYRDNIRSLPFDDKSRVLRTLSSFSVNKDYRYNVQPGLLYQKWLAKPSLRFVRQMVKRRKLTGPDDVEISVTDTDPEAPKAKNGKGK